MSYRKEVDEKIEEAIARGEFDNLPGKGKPREKETALRYLAANARSSGGNSVATYGALKLLPFWDPLRGDPRFEKIVNSLGPK